ncbi:MAG: hypothetical protein RI953_1409, partial [Pseudomonadota bacterium]
LGTLELLNLTQKLSNWSTADGKNISAERPFPYVAVLTPCRN